MVEGCFVYPGRASWGRMCMRRKGKGRDVEGRGDGIRLREVGPRMDRV